MPGRVILYYADHAHARGYVTISGHTALIDDMQERLGLRQEYWMQAFPDWEYLLSAILLQMSEINRYLRGC
jgi:hypothetical protein